MLAEPSEKRRPPRPQRGGSCRGRRLRRRRRQAAEEGHTLRGGASPGTEEVERWSGSATELGVVFIPHVRAAATIVQAIGATACAT